MNPLHLLRNALHAILKESPRLGDAPSSAGQPQTAKRARRVSLRLARSRNETPTAGALLLQVKVGADT